MKITLIGASGFVGTRLIENLIDHTAHHLVNVDKQQSYFFSEMTTIANVLDQELMNRLLKDQDLVVLLAAEHRDDVTPKSLYYDVNVQGMKNVLAAMDLNNVKRIVFFSSVAVYGLNKKNPNEEHPKDPFNDYGKTKWMAEQVLQEWYSSHPECNVNIVRPTVIFGERNRGNVYNLLKQISSGKFLMVGNGNNKKSMAYVGNVVNFVRFLIDNKSTGYEVYNYIDKPDVTMNELVGHVSDVLKKNIPATHFPYWMGMMGGYCFDLLAKIAKKKLMVSSVRVKKFCATTQFDSSKAMSSGYIPVYTLKEGFARTLNYEFVEKRNENDITFLSE